MNKITKTMMVAAVAFATTTTVNAQFTTMRPNMLMTARMDGAQEVPSLTNNATGITSFLLNSTRDTLCINGTFNGLSGAQGGVHIHSGGVGVAGGVILDLSSYVVGNRLSASITGTALSASLKSSMLKGLTYLNVHTVANGGGELRGQIILESDAAYVGALDGAQEVPAVTTTANGYAVFNVAKHGGTVNFYVVANGLSGAITAAHLHTGAVGVAGGVAQDLTTFISGNTLVGSFTPSAGVVASLKAGNIYLNLHTATNGGGEIRAQLKYDDKIAFDALLSGAQEVPAVTTTAKGVASLRLNTTMDSLFYWVYTNGLSGAATAAHLHNGAVGVAGGVAASLANATGNIITGTITGASLTSVLINNMLSGNVYVNIHTTVNGGGEIRGQVYRTMREGLTFSMDGAQEVPAVTTSAYGSGIVTIDRDQTNAHVMLVTGGASITAIHFHTGTAGANGGVAYNILPSYANNGAFFYWKSTDATSFTTAISTNFNTNGIYVNGHTAANAGGEIRGQVNTGFVCNAISVGLHEQALSSENGISIYPNPAKNAATISYTGYSNESLTVSVIDVVGKTILNSTYNSIAGENKIALDLKNAYTGMYFVKISNGKNTVTKKIIVE